MKLVMIRHGLAVDRDDFISTGKADSERPLVAKGRERVRSMAKLLREWGPQFDLIVSSPYTRALQTAKLIAGVIHVSNIFEAPELVPQAPPNAFAQWLKLHADECLNILVVGHEPQLSHFASWCLSGQKTSFMDLKKAGLIGLQLESFSEVHPGHAVLDYLVSPKIMGL